MAIFPYPPGPLRGGLLRLLAGGQPQLLDPGHLLDAQPKVQEGTQEVFHQDCT